VTPDTKITLRPDDQLLADLDTLTAAGAPNRVAAIRDAVHAAAEMARLREAIADAQRLRDDPADRAEIARVRAFMDDDYDAWGELA
jgi:Arc/MetJ-type ribon-helix-helix transcriptional regulator